ncbi:MAG: polyribonucleotide nucleotidyltransferase [Bacteroides sp.]|nr:MAG: polyribonucleotide nucleotidyltransferase [Bacteroides sp.]
MLLLKSIILIQANIYISSGKIATQSDGCAIVQYDNMVIMANVVSSYQINRENDFLNLSVDYQEKFFSTGRIPGGFLKRESKLSNYEILISRLVDRALRPRFPKDYCYDIQVNISLLSGDKSISPSNFACLAASSALTLSDIPFDGPISEVRIGCIDDKFIINPCIEDINKSKCDIIVAASQNEIIMIEGKMEEYKINDIISSIKTGHNAIKSHINAQNELLNQKNVIKRNYNKKIDTNNDLYMIMYNDLYDIMVVLFKNHSISKKERNIRSSEILNKCLINSQYTNIAKDDLEIKKNYSIIEKTIIRKLIIEDDLRLDGRNHNQIRDISCEINLLPSTHGSALFTRGETQVLSTITLGSRYDEQCIDGAMFFGYENLMLHYNFPAFATGEIKPSRAPSRREIGHGNLALNAIKPLLFSEQIPYTIRIVAEVLSSNGSSSMATVCATSLALMDSGIKIKNNVAGIAMGLIKNDKKYIILSDILGDEDHIGDMDLKIAGTVNGITSIQIDLKITSISYEILEKSINQGYNGILHILEKMNKIICKSNKNYKNHAPHIIQKNINPKLIGNIIGPGGKNINNIQKQTNTSIKISNVNGKDILEIFAQTKNDLDNAINIVDSYITLPKIGNIYDGIIKNILSFGAFIEFMPGKEGLLHISEISSKRIDNINDILSIGEKIKIKLIGIDQKTGKFRLSKKS